MDKCVSGQDGEKWLKSESVSKGKLSGLEMLGWKKHKLESRLPVEISITSDMPMTPPLRQKVKRN